MAHLARALGRVLALEVLSPAAAFSASITSTTVVSTPVPMLKAPSAFDSAAARLAATTSPTYT